MPIGLGDCLLRRSAEECCHQVSRRKESDCRTYKDLWLQKNWQDFKWWYPCTGNPIWTHRIYIYIYTYVYIYICMYIYIDMHIYILYIYIHTLLYIYIYLNIYIYIYIHTYIYIYILNHVNIYVYIHIYYITYTHLYIYINICIYIYILYAYMSIYQNISMSSTRQWWFVQGTTSQLTRPDHPRWEDSRARSPSSVQNPGWWLGITLQYYR